MKKLFIFLVIFGAIAIGLTSMLIRIKQEEHIIQDTVKPIEIEKSSEQQNVSKPQSNKQNAEKEKTIDLWGTFDENDLIIEKEIVNYSGIQDGIQCIKIKGLKDKAVEKKINDEMEKNIKALADELLKEKEKFSEIDVYVYVKGNFSNVLSLGGYAYGYYIDSLKEQYGYGKRVDANYNYELINGNELRLEDLFTEDTDMEIIGKMALYREMANSEALFDYNAIKFDKQKGIWTRTNTYYDENTRKINRKSGRIYSDVFRA